MFLEWVIRDACDLLIFNLTNLMMMPGSIMDRLLGVIGHEDDTGPKASAAACRVGYKRGCHTKLELN